MPILWPSTALAPSRPYRHRTLVAQLWQSWCGCQGGTSAFSQARAMAHRYPPSRLQRAWPRRAGAWPRKAFGLTVPAVFLSKRFTRWPSPQNRKRPRPNIRTRGVLVYSSTASTSATNRAASSARNAATTPNTASLKPPMFRMSSRSGDDRPRQLRHVAASDLSRPVQGCLDLLRYFLAGVQVRC